MMTATPLAFQALLRSADVERDFRTAIADLQGLELRVVRGGLLDAAWQQAHLRRPELLLVDVDLDNAPEMMALETLLRSAPASAVIVTSKTATVDAMRRMMRLGIADYLPQPLVRGEVLGVIEAALQRLGRAGPATPHQCKVMTFVRRTGGMGATSLAIQSAIELSKPSKGGGQPKTCLVDLDFQGSAAAFQLDIEPLLDIQGILRAPQRLDRQLLASMTAQHRHGFALVAAPSAMIDWSQVSPEVVGQLMTLICEQHDHVIVDLPAMWARWSDEIVGGSDLVFLVLQSTVAAVKQARAFLDHLRANVGENVALSIVLNRYRRSLWRRGLKLREIERALGRPIDHRVPSDYWLFSGAANHGMPISQFRSGTRAERQIGRMIRESLKRLPQSAPASAGA